MGIWILNLIFTEYSVLVIMAVVMIINLLSICHVTNAVLVTTYAFSYLVFIVFQIHSLLCINSYTNLGDLKICTLNHRPIILDVRECAGPYSLKHLFLFIEKILTIQIWLLIF